ncbi:MAG: hypothetical protein KAI81_06200, partial [Candidatus Marinimicrobia bacterium]|nr:hypothetical protein [Candidatus Neomarinimicrobiota bacterium]
MNKRNTKYLKIFAIPLIVLTIFLSACDWALPTKLEIPTWQTTLFVPIINNNYPLSDLAASDDSLIQVQGDSLFIEFSDSLQTVSLSEDNFFVPVGTDPLSIFEEMDGLSFDPLSVGPDSFSVPIPRDIVLPDTSSPGDSIIYKDLWNGMADTLKLNDSSGVDIPQSTKDNINEYFSAYSIVIDDESEFSTRVGNNSPGIIETIQIALLITKSDGSTYFLANHLTNNLAAGASDPQTTNLEGKRISNLDITLITRIIFAQTAIDLLVQSGAELNIKIYSSLSMKMKEVRGLIKEIELIDISEVTPLPSTNETKIISGVLAEAEADTNRISMEFSNSFPIGIRLNLEFLNITDSLGNTVVIDALIPANGDTSILQNLNSHTLASLEAGEVMDEMVYNTRVSIPASSDTVTFPFDGSPMGDFNAAIQINDFQLASLSGIFNLEMPSPPTAISMPEG